MLRFVFVHENATYAHESRYGSVDAAIAEASGVEAIPNDGNDAIRRSRRKSTHDYGRSDGSVARERWRRRNGARLGNPDLSLRANVAFRWCIDDSCRCVESQPCSFTHCRRFERLLRSFGPAPYCL